MFIVLQIKIASDLKYMKYLHRILTNKEDTLVQYFLDYPDTSGYGLKNKNNVRIMQNN